MRRKTAKWLIVIIIVALLAALYDSNTRLVTDNFSIVNSNLPDSLSGLSIVQLSDLHGAVYGEGNEELFDAVRACNPDIITVTGDIIDSGRGDNPEDRGYITDVISGLCAIAPVYYVTGNHEWASGWTRGLLELIEDCGATVLRNEYVLLSSGEESIVLAGVDDPNGPYDMKTPAELVSEIREREGDKFILMLSHRNDALSTWSELGVDAVLCGHAHGGLIRLPFTDGLISPGRKLFPTHTSGIYTEGGTDMLVSRGAGNGEGTLRLFNNPQVVSLKLLTEQ